MLVCNINIRNVSQYFEINQNTNNMNYGVWTVMIGVHYFFPLLVVRLAAGLLETAASSVLERLR